MHVARDDRWELKNLLDLTEVDQDQEDPVSKKARMQREAEEEKKAAMMERANQKLSEREGAKGGDGALPLTD